MYPSKDLKHNKLLILINKKLNWTYFLSTNIYNLPTGNSCGVINDKNDPKNVNKNESSSNPNVGTMYVPVVGSNSGNSWGVSMFWLNEIKLNVKLCSLIKLCMNW